MTNRNTELFENMSVAKAVNTLAVPTVVGQLIVLIYNMADTFFIGRTANNLMVAGVSLILPVFNISLSLAGLSGIGGGALISRLLGKNDPEEAGKVFSFSVWLGVLLAAVFSAFAAIWMRPLLCTLGADENTFTYAKQYATCVIVCGAVPTVLSNILAAMLRSVGESKKAGFGVTFGGLINIGLDPLFMFLILPEGYEIVGAGVATCLSSCLSCLYFIIVLLRMRKTVGLRLLAPWDLPRRESVGGVFFVGIPSAVNTLLFDLDYIVIGRLMSGYSNAAVAGIGIVLKAERLPLNVGVGLCQGMLPILAYNYASGNRKRMNAVKNYTCLLGLACAAVSILLYELFAGQILRFFIDEAETVALGTTFLRFRCLATPFMFLSFFHVYLFNGFGKGKIAFFLGAVRWLCFNIPLLYLLNFLLGTTGIVLSQLTADLLTVLLSVIVYRVFARRHLKELAA